ncbi:proline iminopeptidase-family hydrolase [Methanoregula sp.]|uniref:proline iminopeptidase-family hydrolase n=1 Tax=Methanoregula sp. TaxID=2052170 RepID=UPI000CBC662F|nr:proline iminopeptidase-family hydrolase [Methanoregula sp.]PKG31831.1 MAG: proline iminopeptidase [Methanoregula sp.]
MPDTSREGLIPVSGGNVWYRIFGADKPGIPLLVLHGGPGIPHDYLLPVSKLADERPVIFYDQLGCGNSDKTEDLSLLTVERFIDELATVRESLGLDPVHILGQSWGSMLAVRYLLTKNPDGIRSLILSGPCLSASRWKADQRKYVSELDEKTRETILHHEANGTFSDPENQEAMMEFYNLHICRMDPWPECLMRSMERFALPVYQYMWGPSEFTITGTLKGFECSERLHKIQVPVLFTCGRYDEATPETTAYYQTKLPGSQLRVFENASHSHHLEQEQEYLATVRKFLKENDG